MPLRLSSSTLRRQASQRLRSAVQHPLVSRSSRALTSGRLRILAYHGVDDLDHFETIVSSIIEKYHSVSGDDIVAALRGERALPKWSVWFTFDDGLKSTLDAGMMLSKYGIRATAFINPATYVAPNLLWFQVLELSEERGLIESQETARFSRRRLKTCPDSIRRTEIEVLASRLARVKAVPQTMSGDVGHLHQWVAQGHEIGNHTWDHPCLDQCDSEQQQKQIVRAHEWLTSAGIAPRFFAYPNGNWSTVAERQLMDLGYDASVGFDHRLADLKGNPHRLSRLRIAAEADDSRTHSILSGLHSGVYGPLREIARQGEPSRNMGRILTPLTRATS